MRIANAFISCLAELAIEADFTENNIALALSTDFQSYGVDDIFRTFGEPYTFAIEAASDPRDPIGPQAPEYVVGPNELSYGPYRASDDPASHFDFDQCFQCDNLPENMGTPVQYMAPEVIVGEPPSKASDVWSLGCTIFRLRCGLDIFFKNDFYAYLPVAGLQQIQRCLGKLPDNIAQARFDEDGFLSHNQTDKPLTYFLPAISLEDKIVQTTFDKPPSLQMTSNGQVDTAEYEPTVIPGENYHPLIPEEVERIKPYPGVYDHMLWKPTSIRVDEEYHVFYEREDHPYWGAFPRIEADEVKLLCDLLSRIFVYGPTKRATLQEVIEHPWFSKFSAQTLGKNRRS